MGTVRGDCMDEPHVEAEILKLRGRWELASVLNFLDVFRPLIGKDLKVSSEEVEMGLVKPDASLAKLHIALLKGTPPVSKLLNDSNVWVTALCKKLTMWWPWVAEGKIPLMATKGEELSKYKELDPSDRLMLLKALCEIRAAQQDAVAYINDALKEGTPISSFCKNALGGDGSGTLYWYDANPEGHRLYRGVITLDSKTKAKGKVSSSLPTINFQWETLASRLEEFSEVAEAFTSSKVAAEVTVGKKIQGDAIPVLEKLQKKKERALKRKQRQDMLLNNFQNTYRAGITRTCRSRRPISYTFDDYDRAIKEAIQLSKKGKVFSNADLEGCPEDRSNGRDDSTDSDSKRDMLQDDSDDTGYEIENHDDEEDNDDVTNELGNSERGTSHTATSLKQMGNMATKPRGVRWRQRLVAEACHPVFETRGLTTKNRLRQRPTRNSALESIVIADSDDEPNET